ncbi:hypothetical protein JZ751_016187 [Albula glossodonta]|uniref:Uncharacterized protein n=1 Tax=Albula glossodonta TaxID=121402 RepID=A0A8T2MVQ4_9TELE|nr:hypothetical protein JZ751_016187 [Albula glossodonta]
MERGTHFSSQEFRAYCPAGCKDVTGDIWGQSSQGYRDTSVLCKAAVHAGVVSDDLGGPVTVFRQRSITLYEASFANGLLSKTGSLSEKKLVFRKGKQCPGSTQCPHTILRNENTHCHMAAGMSVERERCDPRGPVELRCAFMTKRDIVLGMGDTLYSALLYSFSPFIPPSLHPSLHAECDIQLPVLSHNVSTSWEEVDSLGRRILWSPRNKDSRGQALPWVADRGDPEPWLLLELQERSSVTGKHKPADSHASPSGCSTYWSSRRHVRKLGALTLLRFSKGEMHDSDTLLPSFAIQPLPVCFLHPESEEDYDSELHCFYSADPGILTKGWSSGSSSFYVESFTLFYSKDNKNWKAYKATLSKEKKVFLGNSDSSQEVLNSLIPPVVARYLLLRPQQWHHRAAANVQVLGCPLIRPRTPYGSPPRNEVPTVMAPYGPVTSERPDVEKKPAQKSSHPVTLVVVGVVLVLIVCVAALLAGLCWKRR